MNIYEVNFKLYEVIFKNSYSGDLKYIINKNVLYFELALLYKETFFIAFIIFTAKK